MEGLERRVRETVEQYHMLDPGDRVVAAVSGGADSVCLLALLCAWREPQGISIRAVSYTHLWQTLWRHRITSGFWTAR